MSDYPDLDFSVDCPICDRGLDYDGGTFYCEICCVSWPRSGYGHEAESHRADEGLCDARCPSSASVILDGWFCGQAAGHEGKHEVQLARVYGKPHVAQWETGP